MSARNAAVLAVYGRAVRRRTITPGQSPVCIILDRQQQRIRYATDAAACRFCMRACERVRLSSVTCVVLSPFPTEKKISLPSIPVSSMRGSWWQITTPSRVVRTSNSITSTPSLTASTKEGIVFPSICLRRERSRHTRAGRQISKQAPVGVHG